MGRKLGLRVAYAAAPFDADAVQAVLPFMDLLFLNEVEAAQLEEATGKAPQDLGVQDVIVTLGAKGARHFDGRSGDVTDIPALKVTPVDTTGAGDTFTGYVLAALDLRAQKRLLAMKTYRHKLALLHGDLDRLSESIDELGREHSRAERLRESRALAKDVRVKKRGVGGVRGGVSLTLSAPRVALHRRGSRPAPRWPRPVGGWLRRKSCGRS